VKPERYRRGNKRRKTKTGLSPAIFTETPYDRRNDINDTSRTAAVGKKWAIIVRHDTCGCISVWVCARGHAGAGAVPGSEDTSDCELYARSDFRIILYAGFFFLRSAFLTSSVECRLQRASRPNENRWKLDGTKYRTRAVSASISHPSAARVDLVSRRTVKRW